MGIPVTGVVASGVLVGMFLSGSSVAVGVGVLVGVLVGVGVSVGVFVGVLVGVLVGVGGTVGLLVGVGVGVFVGVLVGVGVEVAIRPMTSTGVVLLSVVPSPNWPESLRPQHLTPLAEVRAHV